MVFGGAIPACARYNEFPVHPYTSTILHSEKRSITSLRVFFGLIDKWLRKLTHHTRHQGPKPWLCHTLRTTSSLLNQGNSFQGATRLSRPIFSASKRFHVGDIGDIPPLHPLPGLGSSHNRPDRSRRHNQHEPGWQRRCEAGPGGFGGGRWT